MNLQQSRPEVYVAPDATPFLTLVPGRQDGEERASVLRAQRAQQSEREAAIAANQEKDRLDLFHQEALDSLTQLRIAHLLPEDIPMMDRLDAGAAAARLNDYRWQAVARYHASDMVLVELRKFMHTKGLYVLDSDLRRLAEHLSQVDHFTRLQVWTGRLATSVRDWSRAALGFLSITEEQ